MRVDALGHPPPVFVEPDGGRSYAGVSGLAGTNSSWASRSTAPPSWVCRYSLIPSQIDGMAPIAPMEIHEQQP